jgi:hypothetical protein
VNVTGSEDITTKPSVRNPAPAGGGVPPADPFTVKSVRALLKEHVLRETGARAGVRMPSTEVLAELASQLTYMKDLVRLARASQENTELQFKFNTAIENLENLLPAVIRKHKEFTVSHLLGETPKSWSKFSVDREKLFEEISAAVEQSDLSIVQTVVTLERLVSALVETRKYQFFHSRVSEELRRHLDWKRLAWHICVSLWAALASKRPDFKPGIWGEGPTTRFVAAVIPRITGEMPTESYVGKILKSHWREWVSETKDKSEE